MKEWKSKKELDDFIFNENRYGLIGFVTLKTLKKWKFHLLSFWFEDWETINIFYIVQNGNSVSYHIGFRKRQDCKNETTTQTKSFNINEI